jgi:predicted nucleic acid-binding Zn ribbon protein
MAQRKKRFNAGKWQIHRERCQLVDREPDPERKPVLRISDVVPEVLRRRGLGNLQIMDAVAMEWEELMGAAVAAHSRPGRIDKGVLFVFVDSSVWLSELQRYSKKKVLAIIRERFKSGVRDVRFQLDPDSSG